MKDEANEAIARKFDEKKGWGERETDISGDGFNKSLHQICFLELEAGRE